MSIFEHRKPTHDRPRRSQLQVLQETLKSLEAEPEETAQTADLKQILVHRIAELQRKTA